MSAADVIESVWSDETWFARSARALLTPAEQLFASIVRRRNATFDTRGSRPAPIPALSVGNLTVGGTGKSPVTGWFVRRLTEQGGHPAIVLRGHGDDEWREHALLTPRVPVIVAPDRTSGLVIARTRGADCAVLDDAFQHRQVRRLVDVVLISADAFGARPRLLPAGPYREPLSSLRRADVVLITAKAADADHVARVRQALAEHVDAAIMAEARLSISGVRLVASLPTQGSASSIPSVATPSTDSMLRHPVSWLRGRRISVISGIGNPAALATQLVTAGATIRHHYRFGDHHAYAAREVAHVATEAAADDAIICTLKDAVKLRELWPRGAAPLWYVSQSVVVDRGAEVLDRAVARVLAARTATALTAG